MLVGDDEGVSFCGGGEEEGAGVGEGGGEEVGGFEDDALRLGMRLRGVEIESEIPIGVGGTEVEAGA